MDRKILAWNKNNIEIAQAKAERAITAADEEDREIYGWIRAILWAIGFILDEMHKGITRPITIRISCENLDADAVKALSDLRDEWEKEIKEHEAGRH